MTRIHNDSLPHHGMNCTVIVSNERYRKTGTQGTYKVAIQLVKVLNNRTNEHNYILISKCIKRISTQ